MVEGEEGHARRLGRVAVGAPQVGAVDGAPQGRRQTRQVVLEHVVHSACRHGGDRGVLVDTARHGDRRQVWLQLGDETQRLDAGEPRDVVVDEGDVPGLVGERGAELVLRLDPVPLWVDRQSRRRRSCSSTSSWLSSTNRILTLTPAPLGPALPEREAYPFGKHDGTAAARQQPVRNAWDFSIQAGTSMPWGHFSTHSPQAVHRSARSSGLQKVL